MKKNLFLLGVAVAALASCTSEEVTDVAQNRAIRFSQFVNNNTRAAAEVKELNSYYLFGKFTLTAGGDTKTVYNNESNSITQYWTPSASYTFGAYANGENGKIENATFDETSKKLTFTSYTVDDAKDLVAAIAEHTTDGDVSDEAKVELNFKHMLSQVKFAFTTTDADAYTLKISELKFTATNKADGTYTTGTTNWENGFNGTYSYEEIADVANESKEYKAETESKFVIPQARTNDIEVTFKATISGPGMEEKTADFSAKLAVSENIAGTNSEANKWIPGYRYKYTTEINAKKIAPGEVHVIEFTTQIEEGWTDADNTNYTPTKKEQSSAR